MDNESLYRSVEVARRHRDRFPTFQVIELPRNLGYGGAIDVAEKAAHGDILVFLNQDVVLESGSLHAAVEVFQERPNVGIVGCRVSFDQSDSIYAAGRPVLPG